MTTFARETEMSANTAQCCGELHTRLIWTGSRGQLASLASTVVLPHGISMSVTRRLVTLVKMKCLSLSVGGGEYGDTILLVNV